MRTIVMHGYKLPAQPWGKRPERGLTNAFGVTLVYSFIGVWRPWGPMKPLRRALQALYRRCLRALGKAVPSA